MYPRHCRFDAIEAQAYRRGRVVLTQSERDRLKRLVAARTARRAAALTKVAAVTLAAAISGADISASTAKKLRDYLASMEAPHPSEVDP